MESSGVFSDGDPGRKSSLFIETRSGHEPNEHSLSTATILPELIEESDLKFETENQENKFPASDQGQRETLEENEAFDEDLTPKIEVQSCQSTPQLLRKESSSLNRDVTSRPGSRNLKPGPEVVKRPRSQETKGLATKRSELLQEKPIMPNTNVGSKLKEILSRQPTQSGWSFFYPVLLCLPI